MAFVLLCAKWKRFRDHSENDVKDDARSEGQYPCGNIEAFERNFLIIGEAKALCCNYTLEMSDFFRNDNGDNALSLARQTEDESVIAILVGASAK